MAQAVGADQVGGSALQCLGGGRAGSCGGGEDGRGAVAVDGRGARAVGDVFMRLGLNCDGGGRHRCRVQVCRVSLSRRSGVHVDKRLRRGAGGRWTEGRRGEIAGVNGRGVLDVAVWRVSGFRFESWESLYWMSCIVTRTYRVVLVQVSS